MSRQHDRGDLPPEVRIRMAEDDLDRVDQRFVDTDGKIQHKATNLDMAVRGVADLVQRRTGELEAQFKEYRKESEAKYEALETKTSDEIGGNRKVMVGVLLSTLGTAIAIVAAVLTMRSGG